MEYKKIYDPVHGFIRLSSLEKDLIDSYPFQRLHYIHQLGATYLVYPGASHTRFEHSIGVMELASRIFDVVLASFSCKQEPHMLAYWKQIVRLAALCHDLGHLPFSHLAEKKLLSEGGHERWTAAIVSSSFFQFLSESLCKQFPEHNPIEDLIKISVGPKKIGDMGALGKGLVFSPWEELLSQIITGDFFGADRIDYLLRDARCTGVCYGLFDYQQLIETLRILPSIGEGEDALTLGVEENGIVSCEALLLARYFMHKRVYQYPSVQAYSFHIARFMSWLYQHRGYFHSVEAYISCTDNEVLQELRNAFSHPLHPAYSDARAIFVREHRFEAVIIPEGVEAECLLQWQKQEGISDQEMEISYASKPGSSGSFPVLCGEKLVDARDCFDVSVPPSSVNWLYLSPEHVSKALGWMRGMVPC